MHGLQLEKSEQRGRGSNDSRLWQQVERQLDHHQEEEEAILPTPTQIPTPTLIIQR